MGSITHVCALQYKAGTCAVHMGQLDVAQEYFALLLTERPDYCPDLLQSIGETYMGLGLAQEACPLPGLRVPTEAYA
jgi:hypothetical protein